MNKLRVGVYLDIEFKPQTGGAFSYSERLIEMINHYDFDEKLEVFFVTEKELNTSLFKKPVLKIPVLKFASEEWTFKSKLIHKIFSFSKLKRFKIREEIQLQIDKAVERKISNFLSENQLDLIYYLAPNTKPLNYPFIASQWDLGHKSMFISQKIFNNKSYEKWDYYSRITLQQAFAIFAESNQTKKELVRIESIYENKIFILPLFPSKVIELNVNQTEQQSVLEKWKLSKNEFYFYPAQFWSHKNHFALIKAFKIVLDQNPNVQLLLCGSDKGNMDYLKSIVKSENIENKVIFTGFVTNEELFSFYKNAISLVMPTLLGPTNMPLLEAYYLGCPVLCTDFEGHREQLGNNASYFDPFNHAQIAQMMIDVVTKSKIQNTKYENNTMSILNENLLKLYNPRKTFQ